jgi:hypothetical protein
MLPANKHVEKSPGKMLDELKDPTSLPSPDNLLLSKHFSWYFYDIGEIDCLLLQYYLCPWTYRKCERYLVTQAN